MKYTKICNNFPDKHIRIGGVLCNTHRVQPEKGSSNGNESNVAIKAYNPLKNLLVLGEDKDEVLTNKIAPNTSLIK